jgi:streptomycin 6-kinase
VSPLTIPENLARDTDAAGSEVRTDWLRSLPDVVGQLADRWSLAVGEPYRPGGCCSWVAPVTTRAGERLVLKVAWAHEESMQEADGLRLWDGAGAVRLHAEEQFAHTNAMLLERCVPGTMLGDAESEAEQDLVVAALLRRLWVTPPADHPFRPLELMCEHWARAFEASFEGSPGGIDHGSSDGIELGSPYAIEPAVAREGIGLFRSLPKTAPQSVLLCTDLHAGNVLAAEREPWLAIDPKPYVGDPAYDLLQHMLNCPGRLEDDPRRLAHRMARLTGLDPDRVTAWLFARCVQESPNAPNLAQVATRLATEALS